MGWFTKKEEREVVPELPELPRLPDLPPLGEEEELPQLPSFPSSSIGDRFSRSAIKEAVTGRKEGEEVEADEFEEIQMMQRPRKEVSFSRDIGEIPGGFMEAARLVKKAEPVFVRIDKFEKALDTFEKSKEKIMSIEKMLREVRRLKEKEEEELSNWEKEIQTTKQQIERVDKELFSKIE